MGQQDSKQTDGETLSAHEFAIQVQDSVKQDDAIAFKKWWERVADKRKEKTYDQELIGSHDIMDPIKFAFRHQRLEWRKEGITVASSFFYNQVARRKLKDADFIDSVLLITLPEASLDNKDGEPEQMVADQSKKEEEELQLLAARTFLQMSFYTEFLEALCHTSVLNFLCIVLNQVTRAQDIVTEIFMRLSDSEANLIPLMEGSMGDMLETFFKTVRIDKPIMEEDSEQVKEWKTGTIALSNTAHALGTLVKHGHPCQVDMPTIIKVFHYCLGGAPVNEQGQERPKLQQNITKTNIPDNVQLLAELSQLFFWKCRNMPNTVELVRISAPKELNLDGDASLDFVLEVLVTMWKRCVDTHNFLTNEVATTKDKNLHEEYDKFCVDDLNRHSKLGSGEQDVKDLEKKTGYANMRLCYLNCTLWVLLPIANLRWKLRTFELEKMHLAFSLRDPEHLKVVVGTVRYLVDLPEAQESYQFIEFFGKQLLLLLDLVLLGHQDPGMIKDKGIIEVLLDAISILAMNRSMQAFLAKEKIYEKMDVLCEKIVPSINNDGQMSQKQFLQFKDQIELAVLRTLAEVAIHPSHRLSWICDERFDSFPRNQLEDKLQKHLQADGKQDQDSSNDNLKTIASLLLTVFQEEKFRRPASDIASMFRSVIDWWQSNSTLRYEEAKLEKEQIDEGARGGDVHLVPKSKYDLAALIKRQQEWREKHFIVSVQKTSEVCAPHECVLALSLFSRLALEPRFKILFIHHECLEPLLGCVSVGIWAEAREAAAALANLMWVPDLKEECLVCWLKFDSPKCITVDAANVLVPLLNGAPRPVDIGKGMYKSSWGIEFVHKSGVTLHPDGLKTHEVPGILTSASPEGKFEHMSKKPYEWLGKGERDAPHPRRFTITCWFYWPPQKRESVKEYVLLSSKGKDRDKNRLIFVTYNSKDDEFRWAITDDKENERPFKTPELNPGWHMLALVSDCMDDSQQQENGHHGTRFFIDEWSCKLGNKGADQQDGVFIKNEFYIVGNGYDGTHGPSGHPFGLITDFRIYAKPLREDELRAMVHSRDPEQHPHQLVKMLAERDAATILAQRLDVPDSAAECLRALGSLATLASQRAKIFSVCGRRVLQMIDSPLHMIQRQAARLINNIT